jgi:Holliday junction resolvase RusA-like endonuclease
MKFNIFLNDNPNCTAQEKGERIAYKFILKGGKYIKTPYIEHYVKTQIKEQREEYRNAIRAFLRACKQKEPRFSGPVELSVIFFFQTPDRKKWGSYKITKPDCDNCVKAFIDVLGNDLKWFEVGDQQIVSLHVTKIWSDRAKVSIEINELPIRPATALESFDIDCYPKPYKTPEERFNQRIIKREGLK